MQSISDTITARKIKGLSDSDISKKVKEEGFNELPKEKKRTFLYILFEIIKEPMFILLLSCGTIYMLLGDFQEALMLLAFVFIVIGITVYQENKTEKALEALKDLSSPRALVIRNGEHKRIPGREVVTEDILILSEGDRVPADAIIIDCSNLLVDESLLTGESINVRKKPAENLNIAIGPPGGDNLPFVYSGTLVVSGQGIALVKKIGMNTELGKIGKSLQEVKEEKTNLQKETDSIVKYFGIGAAAICTLIIVLYGLLRGNWLEGFLSGITLAMSILPEEFPVVLTIFLALGAWRMSKMNVLARKQQAIQALGSATVLCTDKTGTLTLNKMAVKKIYAKDKIFSLENYKNLQEDIHEVIEIGILASQKEPFDPMEKALKDIGSTGLKNTEHIHTNWDLIEQYPLSDELLAVSHLWKSPDKNQYIIAAKGAPEAIIDLCHLKQKKKIMDAVLQMSDEGLRVIAVARSESKGIIKKKQHDFDFKFIGLIGYEDPIRQTVPSAIKECYAAGIRVIMITGDYPGTAKNIAGQIGLKNNEEYITGSELEAMDDKILKEKIKSINIFARVVPQQKLRIVNALKANGEIVAMTGDGVNDAPALKSAHIGIAMGVKGTDVARESSSIVLLDDDFTSIVNGVRMGRKIFDNIRKAMSYVLAVHIPIAGITILAVLLGWPLILLPIHILFLELIIDPACSVVFEAGKEEKNVMQRSPRNPKEKIFNKKTVQFSIFQGIVILSIVALVFYFTYNITKSETEARALSFTTLVISNLFLILINKSWTKNIYESLKEKNNVLWIVVGSSIVFLAIALFIPFMRQLFKFGVLHSTDLFIGMAAAIIGVIIFESMKFWNKSGLSN
jgi:P-type Ca2+ transporter type 2C